MSRPMMEWDQIEPPTSIKRDRAYDVRDSIVAWLRRDANLVEWEAGELDDTHCCRINGFWVLCDNERSALMDLSEALEDAAKIARMIAREVAT